VHRYLLSFPTRRSSDLLDYEEGKYPQLQKQQVAVAFLIALETAMRLGEIINLDWANVNFSQRYCTLVDTKNGDRRDVPLSSTARSEEHTSELQSRFDLV